MDKKRLLLAILFLLLSIGIGYLLYWVFFRSAPEPTQPSQSRPDVAGQFPSSNEGQIIPGSSTEGQTLPESGAIPDIFIPTESQRPSQIVNQPVDTPILNPTADTALGTKFYNKQDGKFYSLKPDGGIVALSDQVFFNVDAITWSPSKNESIIEYPDGANIYYNFDTKQQVTLPKHWEAFSFSPQGDQIVAKSMGIAKENRWLLVSDPTGQNVQLVEPMGDNAGRVTVDWSPNRQIVATSRTGEALGADREEILFVGLHGENFKSTIVEGRGIQSTWSKSGDRLLYSVYSARNDFKPDLWIVDASGDEIGNNRKFLNVETWAGKCSFADDRYVYCGVPVSIQQGAGFAPEISDNTEDQLIRIDTKTGLRNTIPMNGFHVIDSIIINAGQKKLFFTDKQRPGLFEVSL